MDLKDLTVEGTGGNEENVAGKEILVTYWQKAWQNCALQSLGF